MGVRNRTAVVTGATSGIGAEIARVLADRGARVAVCGRDRERGDVVVAEITAAGGEAVFVAYDALDPAGAGTLVAAVEEALGPVEILVNNAGTMFFGPVAGHTPETFDTAIGINLRAPFLLTQAALPGMADRRHGRVVFVSSNGASSGAARTSLYAMSKAGLEGLMRALMAEFAASGITFNTVAPGLVRTPLTSTMLDDPAMQTRFAGHHPNGRVGDVRDIAHAVAMLADDNAGHVLANVLTVDGGLTRAIGYAVEEPPADKVQ
ncbi:SDR family oxidoreductase [Patulibacter sp. NPDC049589]|uniref:SDR family NAD(P)-dependent oxidoreductase n=1 Tax=Patulibacter sp. NPDC049589 TaxID=3154731 RepID=UPI0034438A57